MISSRLTGFSAGCNTGELNPIIQARILPSLSPVINPSEFKMDTAKMSSLSLAKES